MWRLSQRLSKCLGKFFFNFRTIEPSNYRAAFQLKLTSITIVSCRWTDHKSIGSARDHVAWRVRKRRRWTTTTTTNSPDDVNNIFIHWRLTCSRRQEVCSRHVERPHCRPMPGHHRGTQSAGFHTAWLVLAASSRILLSTTFSRTLRFHTAARPSHHPRPHQFDVRPTKVLTHPDLSPAARRRPQPSSKYPHISSLIALPTHPSGQPQQPSASRGHLAMSELSAAMHCWQVRITASGD